MDDDAWDAGRSWIDPDVLVHPDSPAGGGGPGGFSRPGVLGSDERGAAFGRAGWVTPGTASEPTGYARRRAANGLEASVADVCSAGSWEWLRHFAVKALGPYSYGLGVAVGLVKGPLGDVASLLELQRFLSSRSCTIARGELEPGPFRSDYHRRSQVFGWPLSA